MPLDYITDNNVNKFYFIPMTENEVSNILGTIKDSAAGWDGLKAFIIKHIKEVIVTPLVHICNRSFMTGIFPNELKIANLVPIFKSGDDMVFSNYRPVSGLPIFPKWLDRLVYNRLIKFINDNNYCMIISSGFKEVNLPSLLLWCWLTKSLKLWITRNVSLVYSWIFQKLSTLFIMKFYYLNWRNMVYKEQSYSG